MDEMSKTCSYCGAEVESDIDFCPQCGKKLGEADPQTDETAEGTVPDGQEGISFEDITSGTSEFDSEAQEDMPVKGRGAKKGMIVAIAAVALVVVLAAGYFLMTVVLGAGGRQLSGPWTGTLVFTKVTCANAEAQEQLKANLNQPNALAIQLYMDDNNSGAVAVSGLMDPDATVPVTYSGGKLKFSFEREGNAVAFEGTTTKNTVSGGYSLKGTVNWKTALDNGTGQKVDASFSGNMDLSMKKR